MADRDTRALKRTLKRMTEVKGAIQKFNVETTVNVVRTNFQLLNDEWIDYKGQEKEIEITDENLKYMDAIDELYFQLKRVLIQAEKDREIPEENTSLNNTMEDLVANQQSFLRDMTIFNKRETEIRLPQINIPPFSGKYSEFPSFRDLFEASIDKNEKISKVHKLQYLKGLLRDDAAALVRHIPVTEANYVEAWQKIKERYDKRKQVVTQLIKQFMDQPSITHSTAKTLHHMCDVSDEVIRGLKVLGGNAEERDPWLIYILLNKLDQETRKEWAHYTPNNDYPTIEQFFKFLNGRSDELESCGTQVRSNQTNTRVRANHAQINTTTCPKCINNHPLSKCNEFLAMKVSDRRALTANKRLCFNCLSANHQAGVCRVKFRCNSCNRKHHSLLHMEMMNSATPVAVADSMTSSDIPSNNSMLLCTEVQANAGMAVQYQSILPTAIVNVKRGNGSMLQCRVLLDSGSQASFVSEACMHALGLPRKNANIVITGLATSTVTTRGVTKLELFSVHGNQSKINIDALIIQKLPSRLPSQFIKVKDCTLFKNLQLADPEYLRPRGIDILIGADKFFSILEDGRVTNTNGSMIAQKTMFGYIIGGEPHIENHLLSVGSSFVGCNLNIDQTLRQFWELEELDKCEPYSAEEQECEAHFKITHRRNENGRYVVRIPFKINSTDLGNSICTATKRFYNLERKLQSNEDLRKEYTNAINDYIAQGHMELISDEDILSSKDKDGYYLPHHAVIKEGNSTTKVRVVFDGSCKTSNGTSINQKMMIGPTIQPTLWCILMRFRLHRIALTADIEKMYRQVLVDKKDTTYQRILWRKNPSDKLTHYRLNTVTFGLASSPFLATRVLKQIAMDNSAEDTNLNSAILNDFYVDDFISGEDTVENAMQLKEKIDVVLRAGGFSLRKWNSNCPKLSDNFQIKSKKVDFEDDTNMVKILGIQWNPAKDTFTFIVRLEADIIPTKRSILAETSRIFDPLGWVSPSIVSFKILMQKLWMLKIDWDETLPQELTAYYNKIKIELKQLEGVQIPRFVHYNQAEYHGFCDASERAYAAVIYCRSIGDDGEIKVNLITAKTKVAPIKQVSIPRLELCGAHLLAKLWNTVKMNVPPALFHAWTDSTVVLKWLSDYPATWKTFVANRTSAILEIIPREQWNHVASNHNPADHASRGVAGGQLVELNQWWNGPRWLTEDYNTWPISLSELKEATDNDEERRPTKVCSLQMTNTDDILLELTKKYSSYSKLIGVLSYILRFGKKGQLKDKNSRSTQGLLTEEINCAEMKLIKWAQHSEYELEINQLSKNKMINKNSKLLSLTPFLDEKGILRVGGRLQNIMCQYDKKHPIILPNSNPISKLIVSFFHQKYLHPGPSLTSHLIKQRFWIIGIRNSIRDQLRKCVRCMRHRAETSKQIMGSLPKARISPARPFNSCGVDYAGPIQLASKRGRGAKLTKGYIAIFICMVTKAIHIEIVSDLTSEAFIATLKRFTSRRGVPRDMYSDNGTAFVGAHRKLKDIYSLVNSVEHHGLIAEFMNDNRITWHFIPPAAPHFGGLWEAAVKSVKTFLIKTTNGANLTYEEMNTLLCQIESILNSRPLSAMSNEDSSYEALTPSHFLIGSASGSIPEEDVTKFPEARLKIWEQIQHRTQHFWKRFSKEYLHTLQQRTKWKTTNENIKVGDLVIVKEDNSPPCKWALARVTITHPDGDDIVRVVTLKTATSTLKRPIAKICKLATDG